MNAVEMSPRLVGPDGETLDRVFGFETEYALVVTATNEAVNRRLRIAQAKADTKLTDSDLAWETVQAHNSVKQAILKRVYGLNREIVEFKSDGTRGYRDAGDHPEESGREHVDFMQGALDTLAGHVKTARRIQAAVDELIEEGVPIKEVKLYANTCNPGADDENSWASHLNMLISRNLQIGRLILPLATHHATRIVWSGAGTAYRGRNNEAILGISEKAQYIDRIFGYDTTYNRALVNLRDEPLADRVRFRRLHDISGETNFRPIAIALRAALDSLLPRAIEVGETFSDLLLENPVVAMKSISYDLTLKNKYRLRDGGTMTALAIQRAMVERAVEVSSAADNVTEQEVRLAECALKLFAALEEDPTKCAGSVDWVAKHSSIRKDLKGHPRDNDESDFAVAVQKAVDYSQLLPGEGLGMRMVRDGRFQDSPDAAILEHGVAMPPTRAGLRGYIVGALEAAGIEFEASVNSSSRLDQDKGDKHGGGWRSLYLPAYNQYFLMPSPHESDTSRAKQFLASLGIAL